MANFDGPPWIPIWIQKWLIGSTRWELNPEERAIWIDFLCLASLSNGKIPKQPIDHLARILNATTDIIDKCINKFIQTGKIEAYSDRWEIKNWNEYQIREWKSRKTLKKKPYLDNSETRESLFHHVSDHNITEHNNTEHILLPEISEFVSSFNAIVQNLPRVERMTPKRREKINNRLKFQPDIEWWKETFNKADQSFIPPTERYPNGWAPDFDWVIDSDDHAQKVHEGRYIQRKPLTGGELWLATHEERDRREAEREKRRQERVHETDGQTPNQITDKNKTTK